MARLHHILTGALWFFGAVCHAQTDTLSGRIDRLDAAVVVSGAKAERLSQPQTGLEALQADMVRRMPALMGEQDLLKAIQMLPGVQSPSDGATGFSVRGGQVDQNLILLDGAPIYCAGHIMGFISMFNNDVLGRSELYKGDFPARFGGRLSSMLEAVTRDGSLTRHAGSISLGLVASKVHVEGPVVPEKLSYSVSVRRSMFDLAFPFIKKLPGGTALHFFDLNAKLSWVASPRDRLSLSAFTGGDKIGASLLQYGLNLSSFDYANRTASLQWEHVFAPSLRSQVTLYGSLYRFGLHVNYSHAIFDYSSSIRETGLRAQLSWQAGGGNTLEAGVQLPYFRIDSGDCVPRIGNLTMSELHIAPNHAVQPNLFVENTTALGWATLRYGLRLSDYTSLDRTDRHAVKPVQTYWGLEPRLSVSARLGQDASLKAAYSRSHQYLQQALVSTSGSPVDVWIAASPAIKPQVSDQYTLGYYQLILQDALELSCELFYKDNRNTPDFVENVGVVIEKPDRENYLRFGRSYAYGAEWMLRYSRGPWNGWLGYTYSKAIYDIPEINGGKPYASPVNHEHSVDFFLSYEISPRLTASACWVYASGAPTTYPVGRYAFGGSYAPVFGGRNEGRLPDYHRLDLSLTLKTKAGAWDFSIYNAYSRHNVWSIAYSYSQEDVEKPRASRIYLFPILPSISYNVRF